MGRPLPVAARTRQSKFGRDNIVNILLLMNKWSLLDELPSQNLRLAVGDRQRYRVKRLGQRHGDVFLAMDTCSVAGGLKADQEIHGGRGSEKL